MKKYVKIAALILVGFIFLGTFGFLYQKSKPETLVYETLTTTIADLEKTTVATGKIEPRDEILIKPQISGIIDVVYKEAGETVKKGEVIAKVKVIPELGQLNAAESRVRLAEINARQSETDFERMKTLFGQKLISAEEYEKLKKTVLDGYRSKKLLRFHPMYIEQRKLMKELQNKGYNDIFIPNMKILSPAYKTYHDALTNINNRICAELGLYYDADYHLVRKGPVSNS